MVLLSVLCPDCQSDQVSKAGKQRYKCQNVDCPRCSFQLDLTFKGLAPEVQENLIDMALNGSGIRDTTQVGKVLASVFGCRKGRVFLKRQALLEPGGMTPYSTLAVCSSSGMHVTCRFQPIKYKAETLPMPIIGGLRSRRRTDGR